MGLKCYRLWAMGQRDSTCRAPPRRINQLQPLTGEDFFMVIDVFPRQPLPARAVALQVAFERQTLKPAFSLDRS
jgi:hypothetical protein